MSVGGQPPVTARKVPVWRTVVDSFRFVFSNLDRFLALGWPPIMIAFAANMTLDVLIDVGGGENSSVADWVTYISLEAISLAMYAVFAVRWHRFYLLDECESVLTDVLGARNWRFLGYTLLLTFGAMVPMMILGLVVGTVVGTFLLGAGSEAAVPTGAALENIAFLFFLVGSILAIVGFIVMFRFYLVLPGAAVDRPLGLGEAWRKMRGNTWCFIAAAILVTIPAVAIPWILDALVGLSLFTGTTGGAPEPTIGALVATNAILAIVGFLATAAGITVLSKFYRHIVGGESGAAAGL